MAGSLKQKKIMNFVYGMGASVVLVGALFKILHFSIGPLTGGVMLTIGLLTEAVIFAFSAFEPVEEDLDWSLVYPELAGGQGQGLDRLSGDVDAESMLSSKLDTMLAEANLDSEKMDRLSTSIQNFAGAAENIAPAANSVAATSKYSEQLTLAASNMESLNSLYKVQYDSASRQSELSEAVAENTVKLKDQMESLATNLSSLNGVYGGMLSAMSNRN
ncbi:gliding motility protein GldL [Aureibaculum algae]|uniref:Gliding motility protein GldL n=2 Tax=Aureibaculum TaxID=2706948 RepID=A0A5B7TRL0_9FLAO|nr:MULTISPECIES: gliding motility protein GldL [Aureibaculum]MBJ2173376.1 gliding motility protein GldL [Aureibaculum flavum]QCX37813.1 gliding motility protein GldL [Aureibaculum algae]